MRRKTLYGTLAVSLLLVSASTAGAQLASPIRFNVHAGAALPVGSTGDEADLGFRVGAGLELRAPLMPIGLRFDGAFDRMAIDPDFLVAIGAPPGTDGNIPIWSITANAVVSPMVSPLYLIGGVGFYSWKVSIDDPGGGGTFSSDSENDFGFNIGAGLSLPLTGFSTFIEARYHSIAVEGENINYVPIVFGIRF
jgi:opacity protein-like surface antigen